MSKFSRLFVALMIGFLLAGATPSAYAVEYGQGSVQDYKSDGSLSYGTVVQLDSKDDHKVIPVSEQNEANAFGVVVDRSQLLITNDDGQSGPVAYVAVSGTYNVLVSTEGGNISAGDYLTISSLDGVAKKASTKEKTVIGRAAAAFDGTGVVLGNEQLKDKTSGKNIAVKLGSIPMTIKIERNPNIKSTKVDVPNFLERLGQQIADKKVNPIRIYLSMAITAVSLITAIIVLYAGVRNSMISIGRNPMSKKSIFRALLEIILTSILVLVIGLFAVYLLLKL